MRHFINMIYLLVMLSFIQFGCDTSADPLLYNGETFIRFDRPLIPLFVQQEEEIFEINVALVTDQLLESEIVSFIDVLEGSTAQAGIHYNLISNEVRIEPGEVTGSFQIEVIKSSLTQPVELLLSLGGENFNQTTRIVMQNPIRDLLFGQYDLVYEWFFETSDAFDQELVPGQNVDEVIAPDMLEEGFSIILNVQPTSNADEIGIVVNRQNAWVSSNFGQATVESEELGVYNIPNETLDLVLRHRVSAGTFGAFPLQMKKK